MLRVIDMRPGRKLARTYSEHGVEQIVARITKDAALRGRPIVRVSWYDSVPGAYRYPAKTDGYLAVSDVAGNGVLILVRVKARNITAAKVAKAAVGEMGVSFDLRYKAETRTAAREAIIKEFCG